MTNIQPPLPDPVNYQYPSGPGISYVPILDGVAGRVRFTNRGSGDKGFTCSLPVGKVVTMDMAASPAPLRLLAEALGSGDTWAQSRTSVTEDNTGGVRKILIAYDGGDIPAMPTNVNPGGWGINIHPWLIHDGSYDNGFEQNYGRGLDANVPTAFNVIFVPYFKIVASSTTPAVTDGTDQTWYLYFAKPLNSNQTAALQVTITTGMFGNLQNLAYTVETNAYGQATALKVTLPMATQHVMFSSIYKISVLVTQSLYYLKGDTFTPESVILISQEFDVSVTLTADTTAPVIALPMILRKDYATAAQQPSILQASVPQPVGNMDFIAAHQTLVCEVTENGGGLDRVELWVEWGGKPPSMITSAPYSGAKGTTHVEIDIQTLPPQGYDNPIGAPAWTRFLFKAYDVAGNVASAYASSPNNMAGVITSNPAVLTITPTGGTLNTTTNQWNACTGFTAVVSAPTAFVSKVEFYVDNVLKTTLTGSQGVPDAMGGLVAWGDYNSYTGSFTGLAAGAHTLKAIVYDAVPNGAFSIQHTHSLELVMTVGATNTGGGCVDLNALISLGNGQTKPAYEVQVGDMVLTRNHITGELAIKPIGAVMPMGVHPVYRLVGADGREGIVSDTHRVYDVSSNAYYEVRDLRPGQTVLREDNTQVTISAIEPMGEREVMTFAIDDLLCKNYFADSTLAHNMKSLDCVLPGTLITMADRSTKPIEDVIPGEQILSYNTKTKQFEADTFVSHFVTRRSTVYEVTLASGHTVTCTGTHTLFTGAVWVTIEQLSRMNTPVHVLTDVGTYSAVASIKEQDLGEVEVRICEVLNNHNLLLGGILCHNYVKSPTVDYI